MARFLAWWRTVPKAGKWALSIGAVIVALVILGAALPSEDDGDDDEASPPPPAAQQPPPPPPPPQPPPPPPPPPAVERAPPTIVLRGQGASVETVNLPKETPTIVGAVHQGSANFIVELVGTDGSELLVNTIGNFAGTVAYSDATAGRYRVRVDADGPWTISFEQPVPTPRAKRVPGVISGRGAKVVKIRAEEDLQPIVGLRHQGEANFIVELIGYGDNSGEELLANEIGNYSGETLVNEMPEGSYLLAVGADGTWTVSFTP